MTHHLGNVCGLMVVVVVVVVVDLLLFPGPHRIPSGVVMSDMVKQCCFCQSVQYHHHLHSTPPATTPVH